jgi:hypothetical protein
MVAASNKLDEKSISFNPESLISVQDNWVFTSGSGSVGATIHVNTNSVAELIKSINQELTYFKLRCVVTCSDHTISTASVHNVAVVLTITYADGTRTTKIMYPSFNFEHKGVDYVIVQTSAVQVSSIDVQIINSEEFTISVTNIGLYYAVNITDSNLDENIKESYERDPSIYSDIMSDLIDTDTDVRDSLDGYLEEHGVLKGVIFDVYTQDPTLAELQEKGTGYAWIRKDLL